ncbi:hypothetical protein SNEBB_000629 [Seison nebaliae]|nr:hypothetical protein SNEBB_000629 [Seison nebaliae]
MKRQVVQHVNGDKRLKQTEQSNCGREVNDSDTLIIESERFEVNEKKNDRTIDVLSSSETDERGRNCPYLDTVERKVLDFDFEKLCSVTLSNQNVYCCLVCGRYFQGRGIRSPAYQHSIQIYHYVYLNLETLKFYCLPENYEIIDSSLDDIQYQLNPIFNDETIRYVSTIVHDIRAHDGKYYLPSVVGLNNIKSNDYANVVLHALCQTVPLRNYFLKEENYRQFITPKSLNHNSIVDPIKENFIKKSYNISSLHLLPKRLGELMRKMWNPRNFRTHVSPHEMLQVISLVSNKQFQITKQNDPQQLMTWLLNALHVSLGGSINGKKSTIITEMFRGKIKIYSKKIPPASLNQKDVEKYHHLSEYQETISTVPFFCLTLNLPSGLMYRNEWKDDIIPQIPLFNILKKYDGQTETEFKTHEENFIKKYEILHLPKYLILYYERFTKNNFFVEKNPTIVNFKIKDVDFRELLNDENLTKTKNTRYNLLANIVHDGDLENGSYRIYIHHKSTDEWYEIQDLHFRKALPEIITLSECYIQIWEQINDNK